MKRRDLLKLGAGATVGGTVAAAGPGCAAPVPDVLAAMAPPVPPERFLAMLDRQLPAVDRACFVDGFVGDTMPGNRTPELQATIDGNDATFRRMLRTLLITQGFRELPKATQVAPAVQERMMGHLDEIDGTVFEITDRLAALSSAQREAVRGHLRTRPELPSEIAAAIDGHAAAAGIGHARRLQLRSMMTQAAFRLKNGDPGAMIDEYVAKVARVRAQTEDDARALALSQSLGEKAFWSYQKHLDARHGLQDPTSPSAPAAASPPPGTPLATPSPAASPTPGRGAVRAGAYMMGAGVVTFGVSALLIDVAEAFVVGLTVGALLFAIGLVTLVIGALIAAAN